MIINANNPHLSVYFLGSELLSVLLTSPLKEFDVLFLYDSLRAKLSSEISFGYFMLTVDWLYVLGLVELTENGDIRKCF